MRGTRVTLRVSRGIPKTHDLVLCSSCLTNSSHAASLIARASLGFLTLTGSPVASSRGTLSVVVHGGNQRQSGCDGKPLRVAPVALCRGTRPPQWLTVYNAPLPKTTLPHHRSGLPSTTMAHLLLITYYLRVALYCLDWKTSGDILFIMKDYIIYIILQPGKYICKQIGKSVLYLGFLYS